VLCGTEFPFHSAVLHLVTELHVVASKLYMPFCLVF